MLGCFVLFLWSIITISRGIRYEFLQVIGFILLILALSLTGTYSYIYEVGDEEVIYLSMSLALSLIIGSILII